jgi:hypothetical protein
MEIEDVRERFPSLSAVGEGLLDKLGLVLSAKKGLDRRMMGALARLEAADARVAAAMVAAAIAVLILAIVGVIAVFGPA